MKITCLLIILLSTIVSCEQPNAKDKVNSKSKQVELKLKDTVLIKQPNTIKTSSVDSVQEKLNRTKFNSDNTKELVGFWFTPHSATINIKFLAEGTYIFNDYNTNLDKEERLTVTYEVTGNTLTLIYRDGVKQKFQFYKGQRADNNYYIKKPGYYFVKGEEQ